VKASTDAQERKIYTTISTKLSKRMSTFGFRNGVGSTTAYTSSGSRKAGKLTAVAKLTGPEIGELSVRVKEEFETLQSQLSELVRKKSRLLEDFDYHNRHIKRETARYKETSMPFSKYMHNVSESVACLESVKHKVDELSKQCDKIQEQARALLLLAHTDGTLN